MLLRQVPVALVLIALLRSGHSAEPAGVTDGAAFLARALELLPVEERYAYHRALGQGPVHHGRRDASARPTDVEMEISEQGWDLVVAAETGGGGAAGPMQFAADDLAEYLAISMGVRVGRREVKSLAEWREWTNVIVAGTREQLPGIGEALKRSKDYEIRVTPGQVVVCGFDEFGVLHGLFNLEERMTLREAPFLPRDLRTVRHSRFQTRMVLSWLGWMQWPDAYLSHLAHDGYDAIFASVYANPNGVEGPPHYNLIRKQDGKALQDLIDRAGRQGIKVYAPILYANTREPENQAKLREHVRDIVTKFPGIRGYILLTEGFYFEKFFGAGKSEGQDLHEWARNWTNAVRIVAEECHRIDPAIEVLPWEYNIDFRPQQVELKRYVTSLLPADTIPLLTWENGKSFELDGRSGYLRDYSISQVGPAEVASAQIDEAKRRGLPVYCKADCFATWQFGTTPYLPCPQQWQRRYDALAERGIDGTLETWSNGYKPNFIAELRAWSCWTDPLDQETLLRSIARRAFGAGNEELVIQAWEKFSEAIRLVPDTGPSMGTNSAVANPLFFDEPPPRIMTLDNSWWDEEQKTPWRHRMNRYWPFAHPIMVFMPDFRNRTNQAEAYARRRSGIDAGDKDPVLPVFNKYVLLAADRLEAGLKLYRQAALGAPPEKQASAFQEVLLVEQMQRMLRSLHAILEFEDLRFRLMKTDDRAQAGAILDRLTEIVAEEIARTQESLEIAKRDSRLGYECEMDYVYSPFVLEQKLDVLEETLTDEIPACREQRGQR